MSRSSLRRRLGWVLPLAVAVAVFAVALPRIAGYGAVGRQLACLSPPWLAALFASASLDVFTLALPWLVLLPELTLLSAVGFTQASTALSTVVPGGAPVGMAISFGILRRRGIGAAGAGRAVVVTGVWSQVLILLYPLAGVAAVLAVGRVSRDVGLIALASAAAAFCLVGGAALLLRTPAGARRLGDLVAAAVRRVARREPAFDGDALVRVRADALLLVRRRFPALTLATLANHLSAYLVFVLAVRGLGIGSGAVSLAATFLAWAVGRLIASLPLTPGGIGVVELGLVGTLVGLGAPQARAVAAVLLYRALLVVPTLALGAAALAVAGRRRRG